MMNNIREDLDRYFFLAEAESPLKKLYMVLFTQGIWATLVYRSGRYLLMNRRGNAVKVFAFKLLGMGMSIGQKFIEVTTGISIPFAADIGPGLYIGHFGALIVHSTVKIGAFCNLSQCVTIGEGGRAENRGAPVLGDFVWVGPGAKIFGNIHIGNEVAIGANAVVNRSLPDVAVAAGIPCNVVNYRGSRDFIRISPEALDRWKGRDDASGNA